MSTPYPALFTRYGERAIARARRQLRASSRLDGALQQTLMGLLDIVLDDAALWPATRDLMLELAPQAEQEALAAEWEERLSRAIARARAQNEPCEAHLLYYLGRLFQQQVRLDQAREYLRRSARHFAALDESEFEGRARIQEGLCASKQGVLDAADECLRRTAPLVERAASLRAPFLGLQGVIAYDRGQSAEAKRAFEESLAIWERSGTPREIAYGLLNLGTACRKVGALAQAAACQERAIALLTTLGEPRALAIAQLNLGNVHHAMGQHEGALRDFAAAERFFNAVGDPLYKGFVLNGQGMALHRLGRYDEASESYEASLSTFRGLGYPGYLINTLANLADMLDERGRHEEALRRIEEAARLVDQVSDPIERASRLETVESTRADILRGASRPS